MNDDELEVAGETRTVRYTRWEDVSGDRLAPGMFLTALFGGAARPIVAVSADEQMPGRRRVFFSDADGDCEVVHERIVYRVVDPHSVVDDTGEWSIVKADADDDLYLVWSDATHRYVWAGARAALTTFLRAQHSDRTWADWDELIADADDRGTSDEHGTAAWDADQIVIGVEERDGRRGFRILPRAALARYARALRAGDVAVCDALVEWEDYDDDTP